MNAHEWHTARVSLVGHTLLGDVECRFVEGGMLEVRSAETITRYGPNAIFSHRIEVAPPPLPEPVEGMEVRLHGAKCKVLSITPKEGDWQPKNYIFLTGNRWLHRREWASPAVEILSITTSTTPYTDEEIPF